MKKSALSIFLFLVSIVVVHAQGGLGNAIMAYEAGKLNQAKAAIDEAIKNPKASTKSKTWYYYGKIYAGIASDPTGLFINLDKDATFKAYEGFKKAMELEPEKKGYYNDAKAELEQLYAIALNRAVAFYQEQDLDNALKNLELSLNIQPKDTTALIYSAAMAYEADKKDKYVVYTKRFLELDGVSYERKAEHYYNLILVLYNELKKPEEAIAIIEMGLKENPKDARLYELAAAIYDEQGDAEKAFEYYRKGAELFPDNFVLNANTGFAYYNQAVLVAEEIENMSKSLKKEEAEAKLRKMDELLKKALPYLERAHKANSENKDVITVLSKIYYRLKMEDKGKAMDAKLKALGAN
jgi:tetratricopeptide (TPR) repeat protein